LAVLVVKPRTSGFGLPRLVVGRSTTIATKDTKSHEENPPTQSS